MNSLFFVIWVGVGFFYFFKLCCILGGVWECSLFLCYLKVKVFLFIFLGVLVLMSIVSLETFFFFIVSYGVGFMVLIGSGVV